MATGTEIAQDHSPAWRRGLKLWRGKGYPLPHPVTGEIKTGDILAHLELPRRQYIQTHRLPVRISGWAFDAEGRPPLRVMAKLGDRTVVLESGLQRQDVQDALQHKIVAPLACGFDGEFRTRAGFKQINIVAEWADGSRYLIGQRLLWVARKTRTVSRWALRRMRRVHTQRNLELRQLYENDCPPRENPQAIEDICDVIIPVYRGLEETRRCLQSIHASQPFNRRPFEVIVINDHSPEPELTAFLEEEAGAGRITLLDNKENAGFVATANRGLCLHPARHAILLNSDTEVFHDWIDRILEAAEQDERIATLTPFSNNATICSYPVCAQDNDLPQRHNAAELDQFCREENASVIHDIPSGVGYCMFIRRQALDAIGYFDIETFGKGYGEENDFCRRAALEGWRNVLLCNTFVHHKGAVSFLDTRQPKVDRAVSRLNSFFPGYDENVRQFIQSDPARHQRLALDQRRLAALPQERILCICHSRSGGSLQHIVDLSQHAGHDSARLLIRPLPNQPHRYEALFLPELTPINLPARGLDFDELAAFCRQWEITSLEYHHLADQEPRIMDLPDETGLPYRFIAHDYHAYCPQITLTDAQGRYCGEPGLEGCEACLCQRPVRCIDSVKQWREQTRAFLAGAESVEAPSQGTVRHLEPHFPEARILCKPHREENPEALAEPLRWRHRPDEPLCIGVLGALSREKGAERLETTAIDAASRGLPLRFVLFGYPYRNLAEEPVAHLAVTGAYRAETIDKLLEAHRPHLFWFPAQWPETYSYTLSLALERHYPVVAPELGAFPERLEGRALAWTLPWDASALDTNDFFMKIVQEHTPSGQAVQGSVT